LESGLKKRNEKLQGKGTILASLVVGDVRLHIS